MVRTKSSPLKSLSDVNYDDPSIVFWFFGQQTSSKRNIQVGQESENSASSRTDKSSKRSKISRTDVDVLNTKKADPLTHPLLALRADVPALTDMQIFITEAILLESGRSCTFEKIYEYVSKRWKNVRRRDGSVYTTDCRRAILANLRHNPHHMALFRRDKAGPDSGWFVCYTIEEALETQKENAQKALSSSKRGKTAENGESKDLPKREYNSDEEEDLQNINTSNPDASGTEDVLKMDEKPMIENEESSDDKEPAKSDDLLKKKSLQKLISDCINDNGGSCHFDLIVHHVTKCWNDANMGDAVADGKAAIVQALTSKSFKRDGKRTGWWMIGETSETAQEEDAMQKLSSRRRNWTRTPKSTPEKNVVPADGMPSPISMNFSFEEAAENSEDGRSSLSKDQHSLTDLQILIIEAIEKCSGAATFDQIHEHVVKSFGFLKRRDGTPYTSDCKRAIQASLSSNPSASKPFFKRDPRRGANVWTLAKKSAEFLEEFRKKFGEAPLPLSYAKTSEQKRDGNNTSVDNMEIDGHSDEDPNDSSLAEDNEEVIRDEEEEDNDEEFTAKNEDAGKDEEHESKAMFGNRQKRARRIQEKAAGKRISSRETRDRVDSDSNILSTS
eukprot:TRINITY_DN4861_c0_g1_i1.p1 TRINITY_DN4861_c0_g1~~TRINITY_DN4861_c0_g1_i1.p1  ORF type:complete len:615 (+),score=162.50 TRINITY_DN4861_c0_g1_i1:190-2034(+)